MTRGLPEAFALAGTGGLFGALLAWLVHGATFLSAALVLLLALTTAGIAWRITRQPLLAGVAGVVAGLWEPIHLASVEVAALAFIPAVLLLVQLPRKWQETAVAALAGGALAWLVAPTYTVGLMGGAIAGVLALARPQLPTGGQIQALRTVSLFAPAALLLAALSVNAVTGQADVLSVKPSLLLGVGLAGLLCVLSLAGLGLATLLESGDASQQAAWLGLALAAGPVLASLVQRDLALSTRVLSLVGVPTAVLVAVALGRLRTDGPGPAWLAGLVVSLPVVAQLGL